MIVYLLQCLKCTKQKWKEQIRWPREGRCIKWCAKPVQMVSWSPSQFLWGGRAGNNKRPVLDNFLLKRRSAGIKASIPCCTGSPQGFYTFLLIKWTHSALPRIRVCRCLCSDVTSFALMAGCVAPTQPCFGLLESACDWKYSNVTKSEELYK